MPNVPAQPARRHGGARYYDIRDYGAVTGSANAVVTRKAIQAAIDANPEYHVFHTVYIPSGDWYVDRTVFLDAYIHLHGDPRGSSVVTGLGETTPFCAGISRKGRQATTPLLARQLDGATGAAFNALYLDPLVYSDLVIGCPAPAAPAVNLATTGSAVAAAAYDVKVTYAFTAVGATTAETAVSAASSSVTTTGGNSNFVVTSPAASGAGVGIVGATGYNVYVRKNATGNYIRVNGSTPVALGTNYTQAAVVPTSGTAAPVADASSTVLTSAASPFTAGHDAWVMFIISAGTGSFVNAGGHYTTNIQGVTPLGAAVFAASLGTTGSTGGVGHFTGEHVVIPNSPFTHGIAPARNQSNGSALVDCYGTTNQVTIEWQQDLGTAPLYIGPVMGLVDQTYPAPWYIGFAACTPVLNNFHVDSGGSGYTSAPTVTVTTSGGGGGVTATCTVSGGVVNSFTITNPGTGIVPASTFTVAFSGGGGSGAAATLVNQVGGTSPTAGVIRVTAAIADGSKRGGQRTWFFALPANLTGKVDFAVTMSPLQGVVAAWVGTGAGIPVRMLLAGGSSALPATGSAFTANVAPLFHIGGGSSYQGGWPGGVVPWPSTLLYPRINRTITGLRFWSGAPYALGGATGSAMVRNDATAVDLTGYGSRYFKQEAGVLAWIPFTDAPADVLATRQFTVNYGNGAAVTPSVAGYLVSNAAGIAFDWQQGSIQDLTVICPGQYGAALLTGMTINYNVVNCTLTGGLYGLGGFPSGANYVMSLHGLNTFSGTDTALMVTSLCTFLQTGMLGIGAYGRQAVLGAAGAEMRFDYLYVGYGNPNATYVVRICQALEIGKIHCDFEVAIPATRAFFFIEAQAGTPNTLSVILGQVNLGFTGPQLSLILLDEAEAGNGMGEVKLDGMWSSGGGWKSVIETTGQLARGDITATWDAWQPAVLNSGSNALGNVNITHRFGGFPRRGTYTRANSRLRFNQPADAQHDGARCTQTGTLQMVPGGGKFPPRWVGTGLLDDTGVGLATYVQANPAWTAGGAVAARGPVGELVASQFLDAYFGVGKLTVSSTLGALAAGVPTPPASVVAALQTDAGGAQAAAVSNNTVNGEVFTELVGVGYARQTITFAASSGGVIASNAAITFTLPAAGLVPTAVAIIDPGSASVVGMAPIDPGAAVPGTTFTVASGALQLQYVPVPAGGPLAPQMGYVGATAQDAFNNFYLRATTFTAPTMSFALSTAPASASAPTEPSGNGYARVAAGTWRQAPTPFQLRPLDTGTTVNATTVSFPAVTGGGYGAKSIYLLDGSGNVLFAGNLTVARNFTAGQVPTVAAGSFFVSW